MVPTRERAWMAKFDAPLLLNALDALCFLLAGLAAAVKRPDFDKLPSASFTSESLCELSQTARLLYQESSGRTSCPSSVRNCAFAAPFVAAIGRPWQFLHVTNALKRRQSMRWSVLLDT